MPSGRDPKHPSQRRRRNKGPDGSAARPAARLEGEPPDAAPPLPGRSKLGVRARQWWEAVWASPMAVLYLDADVPAIARGALLVDRAHRDPEAPSWVFSEIRQLEDRLGLSPLARRRLQWEIAAPRGASRPAPAPPDIEGVTSIDRYRQATQADPL